MSRDSVGIQRGLDWKSCRRRMASPAMTKAGSSSARATPTSKASICTMNARSFVASRVAGSFTRLMPPRASRFVTRSPKWAATSPARVAVARSTRNAVAPAPEAEQARAMAFFEITDRQELLATYGGDVAKLDALVGGLGEKVLHFR